MTAEANVPRLLIARVDTAHGWRWIKQGWELFKASPWQWVLTMILYLAINVLLDVLPVIGALIQNLLSPILLAGLMLGCHAQAGGELFRAGYLFAAFRRPLRTLLRYAVLYVALSTLIMLPAFLSITIAGPEQSYGTVQLLGMFVSALLFAPLLMATLFPPVLLMLHPGLTARQAMWLSFWACYRNILPFFSYGLIALLLLVVAALPMFLGLLILMPVLTASVYFAYLDLFLGADQEPVAGD